MPGRPWVLPIAPEDAVGTGHRWLEPVSAEGIHRGIDVQAVRNTPVRAAPDSVVSGIANHPRGLGLQVHLQDPRGTTVSYGHLERALVGEGQSVRRGQTVALVGSTGNSTGPHLDARIQRADGQYVNPAPWLDWEARLP